ncbi:MAG TPA: ornithine carbamoyltransferase [Planctomycetaceae bacterium]|nr:ornithine carbamoyltransferase [Planctomycetaceae bacterium]
MKHFDNLDRLTAHDLHEVLRLARDAKDKFRNGERPRPLDQRVMTLVFEKPSLRTRVSFEAAAAQLGGSSLFLTCADAGLNGRESVTDVARMLGAYSDWIVMRTFSQRLVDEFVQQAGCPVINGLSDQGHPCQALSDLLTMQEVLGSLAGKTVAFIGDGNNVARSLAKATALMGMRFVVSSPAGYQLPPDFIAELKRRTPLADVTQTADPRDAVAQADVVYTDVWASMGQEAELDKRKLIFAPYQVNAALMAAAPPSARFMHCLPARRNMEVTDEVLDGPQSIAILQAENRLHGAKGILLWLLGMSST